MSIDEYLDMAFIEEHILIFQLEEQKGAVPNSHLIAITEQGNTSGTSVLSTVDNGKLTIKTFYETVYNAITDMNQSVAIAASKQLFSRPQFVAPVLVTRKEKFLLHIDLRVNLAPNNVCKQKPS